MKTFSGLDESFEDVTHKTARISLSRDEQGIPDGFQFEALCGATTRETWLDFENESPVTCGKCKDSESEDR
jgi:hypothetical protein